MLIALERGVHLRLSGQNADSFSEAPHHRRFCQLTAAGLRLNDVTQQLLTNRTQVSPIRRYRHFELDIPSFYLARLW